MEKECLSCPSGPPVAAPYSPAVGVGDLIFVSGQGPMDPGGNGVVRGTIEEEARLTLNNLKAVLEDNQSSLEQVVKVNVYLADIDHFGRFNEVYGEFFTQDFPARTCIEAGGLPLGFQVEIEAVALRGV